MLFWPQRPILGRFGEKLASEANNGEKWYKTPLDVNFFGPNSKMCIVEVFCMVQADFLALADVFRNSF